MCPTFNLSAQQKSFRRTRLAESAAEITEGLLEPFDLFKQYPQKEREENGKFVKFREIQPHQQKFHDNTSLSGKRAKFILFSGGVGCLSGDTVLEDVLTGEALTFAEWKALKRRPHVWAFDKKGDRVIASASIPFIKDHETMIRIQTEGGNTIKVAAGHKFLTAQGYRKAIDLVPGSRVFVHTDASSLEKFSASLPASQTEPSEQPSFSPLSLLRELFPLSEQILLVSPAQIAFALCAPSSAHSEEFVPCLQDSTEDNALSTLLEDERNSWNKVPDSQDRYWPCSGPDDGRLLWDQAGVPTVVPLRGDVHGYNLHGLLGDGLDCKQEHSRPYPQYGLPSNSCAGVPAESLHDDRQQFHASSETSEQSENKHDSEQRFPNPNGCQQLLPESLQDKVQEYSLWVPPVHYYTITEEIITGAWVGEEEDVYDIGVPLYGNYVCQGFLNSNSGKSLSACVEIVRMCRLYPGIKIVVVSGYDYYFDEFLMPTFWDVFPEENNKHKKSYNYKTRSLKFTNGSQIRWKAYDDFNKVKGWEAHVIWIEEASELGDGNTDKALQIFYALNMRLRATRPKYPLRMIITQNPKGHNWTWRIFIKDDPNKGARQKLGDEGKKTVFAYSPSGEPRYYCEYEKVLPNGDIYYCLAVNTAANAHVPMGYVESMVGQMADDPQLKQRMVDGMFNPIQLIVYAPPWYSEATHLIEWDNFIEYWELQDYPEIPKFWPVIVGIDTAGASSPWAIEFYVKTEEDHWICFDELYLQGYTYDEITDKIKAKVEGFTNVEYWIDPISSQQKQGPTSTTIEEEFKRRGISVNKPKGYSKTGGMLHVRSLLKPDRSMPCPYKPDSSNEDDDTGEQLYDIGSSRIYYLTKCPHKFSEKNPEGHACPGNIAEKRVFRYDHTKIRQAKESEEGLTPIQSEKFVDRDDHAQTAEMFVFLGKYAPVTKRQERDPHSPKRQESRYGSKDRRRKRMGM